MRFFISTFRFSHLKSVWNSIDYFLDASVGHSLTILIKTNDPLSVCFVFVQFIRRKFNRKLWNGARSGWKLCFGSLDNFRASRRNESIATSPVQKSLWWCRKFNDERTKGKANWREFFHRVFLHSSFIALLCAHVFMSATATMSNTMTFPLHRLFDFVPKKKKKWEREDFRRRRDARSRLHSSFINPWWHRRHKWRRLWHFA